MVISDRDIGILWLNDEYSDSPEGREDYIAGYRAAERKLFGMSGGATREQIVEEISKLLSIIEIQRKALQSYVDTAELGCEHTAKEALTAVEKILGES